MQLEGLLAGGRIVCRETALQSPRGLWPFADERNVGFGESTVDLIHLRSIPPRVWCVAIIDGRLPRELARVVRITVRARGEDDRLLIFHHYAADVRKRCVVALKGGSQ